MGEDGGYLFDNMEWECYDDFVCKHNRKNKKKWNVGTKPNIKFDINEEDLAREARTKEYKKRMGVR